MKFIINSKAWLKALQCVSGATAANSVLTVIESFLFELKGNVLSVSCTDLETSMRIVIDVSEAEGKGAVCIPAKHLVQHLKNLPEQPLVCTIDVAAFTLEMKSETGRYYMTGQTAEDFPKMAAPDDAKPFVMTAHSFIDAIERTLFAASNDSLRPAITGVFIELGPDGALFVATDAHRLVQCRNDDGQCAEARSFIVPQKCLKLLCKAFAGDETELQLSSTDAHLFIKAGRLTIACRLIDARYPDYKAVIPVGNPNKLIVNRADFINVLKRIKGFSNKTTNMFSADLKGDTMSLQAADLDFGYEASESLPCSYSGQKMRIAFNAKFMLEMANNITGDDIEFDLGEPTKAAMMYAGGDDRHTMLLMPLMAGV